MSKIAFLGFLLACSCGSDSSPAPARSGSGSCSDLSGSWTVDQHCDASLVGMTAAATQTGCSLTFAAPFDGFTGTVAPEGTVTLSGPQSCSGKQSGDSLVLTCTPGTCAVTLTRTK